MKKIILPLMAFLLLIIACSKENPGDGKIVNGDFKEFKITAKKFAFEQETIEINRGDKVRWIVTRTDVPHGIGIPFTIEFIADKEGTFTSFCTVFCGSGHSDMKGKIIVK